MEIALFSFLLFYFIFQEIETDVYLGIYIFVVFILYLAAGNYRNTETLQDFLTAGFFITIGFVVSKLAVGCTFGGIFSNVSALRFIFMELYVVEYIIFWLFQINKLKQLYTLKEYENGKLFSVRESDLERLSLYLSKVDVVGINGTWGSGKSFLVDEYIERNCDNYEIIKVEPLTCDMSSIESYLFQQLEKVLLANRIYPRYSRKIQRALSENSWGKQLYHLFNISETDELTAFEGFCQDLDKLENKILLVYEDIDRISKENRDQIARLFDLSQKMVPHNVKVIYQFDIEKMETLDFNRDYLEKYIPYIINLTDISVKNMVINGLEELEYVNADLKWDDFRFLFRQRITDYFLGKEFKTSLNMQYKFQNVTPRKVKMFVTEINMVMEQEEFANKENRNTVIAFFFLKHFFDDLYRQMNFENSLLEEMKFSYKNRNTGKCEKITILELIERHRLGNKKEREAEEDNLIITTEEIKHMFLGKEDNEEALENLNKLAMIILLGYKVQIAQKKLERENENRRNNLYETNSENELNQELQDISDIEHNQKISRLIFNLHQNGRSEYTDAEAVAATFIKDVLSQEKNQWKNAWISFQEKLFQSEFFKDNTTVFRIVSDKYCMLFRALWIYFSKHRKKYDKDIIFDRALEFYKVFDKGKVLSLEKIAILSTCEFDKRKYFLKTIDWFNGLEISGHFNDDIVYINFLTNYTERAFKHGYLKRYDFGYLHMLPRNKKEKREKFVKNFLKDCIGNIIHSEVTDQIAQEIESVTTFYEKNLSIIQETKPAEREKVKINVRTRSEVHHTNETVFAELEKEAKSKFSNKESQEKFKEKLFRYYDKEYINLRELLELWREI